MSQPRFTTGSTMNHVAVMTATSAVGLMSLFLVDAANLFYISLLGPTELAAAIGFAGTLQFFMISVSIGLSIAATAVVSRAIGAGRDEDARRLAASSLTVLVTVLSLVSALLWVWRWEALGLLGATGETQAIAARFLAVVLPGMPLLGIGMVSGGLLRAVGAARQAMYVTLGGGLLAAILDPLFIFGFGLGVDGAAIVTLISRCCVAGIGLSFAVGRHKLIARPRLPDIARDLTPLMAIALPAVATQVSTPFGMAYLTSLIAPYGDDAVAGWAVVNRLTALSFGGIFALSGAVGPILGQNLGAGLFPRLMDTYRSALIFAALYVSTVWAVLLVAGPWVADAFGLVGAGREVFLTWTRIGAGAYLLTASLFVANACFNNLGRPRTSTVFNWSRDALVIPGVGWLIGSSLGAAGIVVVQAVAGGLVGLGAAWAARRHIRALQPKAETPITAEPYAESAPYASQGSYGAVANEEIVQPLAEGSKPT
ncbi:MAG: MATE family efflux transporter [Pseudomonadota bacterium]